MKNHVQHSEILNTITKAGIKNCAFQGKTEYTFDNHCKGYILNLVAGQITVPRSNKDSISLANPYIVIQWYVYPNKLLTLELSVSDLDGVRRRLIITQGKQVIRNTLHARIPNSSLNRNIWTDLCIDIPSLFNLSFPKFTYRSLEGIFISGTVKLRKIISLLSPADQLLPSISEAPKFGLVSQTLDSSCFPQHLPNYNSASPVKADRKLSKINIFKKSVNRIKELGKIKREYIIRANIGPRVLFKSPKLRLNNNDILRKITHNHYNEPDDVGDEIQESIEVEKNSWEDELMRKMTSKEYDSPEFYLKKFVEVCSIRHMTPPFVYLRDNISYNPFFRYYENL
jgi:hypothetical protein